MAFINNSKRYKTDFIESYENGIVHVTFSLSQIANELLNDQVDNKSAFVNDLVIEALQEKEFWKRNATKKYNALRKELVALGYDIQMTELPQETKGGDKN